ncbi:hypothetical protein T11_13464 [Trichinella zimbabwensis]|uniref:Uncharacterized protein n=1 Tax=Trichinella zimbabwensis TaxID=268475 RepID=A0A0V1H4G2_9BILA|nr:hypothetical protein T11_13464 [Trichinella zimbabwensis]
MNCLDYRKSFQNVFNESNNGGQEKANWLHQPDCKRYYCTVEKDCGEDPVRGWQVLNTEI